MIEIEKPRIERVESGESYGKFVVEPLEHGFGQTLGNSLRRVLLSSLPGVAVSSIRIEGIQHEFSAVTGVKEDVAEIILNLKELSAKLYCDGPKTVSINVKGPCELTAAALEVEGVAGLGTGFGGDVAAMVNRKSLTRSVRLDMENDEVSVGIAVLVKYGYVVPDVAKEVQEAVKGAMENTSGLNVICVNVTVAGVAFAK